MVQHVRRFCHKTPIVSTPCTVLVVLFFIRWNRLYYYAARIYIHVCVFHVTGLLPLAEGPNPLSVSVVQLSRNDTIQNFFGLLY